MDAATLQLLLADDDRDDRALFKDALDELTISTVLTTVRDGEELMNMLRESPSKLPDLIFLDLNMPRKNGFECLLEIKRTEHLRSLPVIIFSTSFDPDIVEMLFSKGAWHYVRKPNEFDKLKQLIGSAIASVGKENTTDRTAENFVLQF